MKSAVLALIAVPAFVFAACSQGGVDSTGSAGGSSSGGSGSTTAGSSSGGSASSTAGSSTAGTSNGTAGSSVNSAGTSSTGGTPAGMGGSSAGTSSSGGAGSSAGGNAQGGGSGNLTMDVTGMPNNFGDALMSSYFIIPCYGQQQQDCLTIPSGAVCPPQTGPFEQQGFTQTETFKLGGTAGTMYAMNFTLNGITEGKYYQGGTRDAGDGAVANADSDAGSDTFYRGGTPVAQEHYNIYKMTVKNPDGSELAHYYLNSFPPNVGRYENHNTFALHYTKTIPVPGGGSVEYFVGDSNCHAVDNCGPGEYNGTCTKSRNIPSEPNFMVPAKYMGKNVADLNTVNGAKQPYHAQLIHITVNSIMPM